MTYRHVFPTDLDALTTEELARLVVHHKRLYYAGKDGIPDEDYDKIEERLRLLCPEHPSLAMVGTDELTNISSKVAHQRPMLSLDKTYDRADLLKWISGRGVLGMLKVDGASLSLIYQGGRLGMGKTRGDGRHGEDVTKKVLWVDSCPKELTSGVTVEVRGEIHCPRAAFLSLVDSMTARGLERPTSIRNIVAGVLGRKSHIDLASHFEFLAFDVIFPDGDNPFTTEDEKFHWLARNGFKTPFHCSLSADGELEFFLDEVRKLIDEGEILADGAVFSVNDLELQNTLGSTSHHPRYKIAFKWQGETARSIIENIVWDTSRFGVITPVAVIAPVHLSGAQITNVTLHNAATVIAGGLKVGDEIEIVRSGEVIPKFLSVTKRTVGEPQIPVTCPSCTAKTEFDGVRLRCMSLAACPAQRDKTILNWIRAVGIEELSEKRLETLVSSGLVKLPSDLYLLKSEDLSMLPLFGAKLSVKLISSIEKTKSPKLVDFLTGLGVEGMGEASWEKLTAKASSLSAVLSLSLNDIEGVEGFAAKTAEQVLVGLSERRDMIERLAQAGVKPLEASPILGGVLSGLKLVITGALSSPRAEIERLIKSAGGEVSSGVSKATTAVVTNDQDKGSSKLKKAIELQIPIWNEEELRRRLGLG